STHELKSLIGSIIHLKKNPEIFSFATDLNTQRKKHKEMDDAEFLKFILEKSILEVQVKIDKASQDVERLEDAQIDSIFVDGQGLDSLKCPFVVEVANMRICTVKDVPSAALVMAMAAHLKANKMIELPKWHDIVKTGCTKELPPLDEDWFFIRAAAILRRTYVRGQVGIGAFRKIFGEAQNNGNCPSHFRRSSGAVIRQCVKGLEKAGLVKKVKGTSGRSITRKGQQELDKIARGLRPKK
ncbi:Ribosomal protein S19e like protein, partial [Aduncisulcus paluster]